MQTPAEFVEEWQETLASHDVDAVVELYKDDAVLLGTVDKGVRKGTKDIREYFKNFLRLAPIGKITYIICEELSGGSIAIANGLYDFELHEDGQVSSVPARFTFVLENVDLKWKILSHHSSRISASPESS